jgi:hypothetical protein
MSSQSIDVCEILRAIGREVLGRQPDAAESDVGQRLQQSGRVLRRGLNEEIEISSGDILRLQCSRRGQRSIPVYAPPLRCA